jgi:hypothetical protein
MRSLPIPKLQLGRTFFIAAGVLALGAAAQIVALGWKQVGAIKSMRAGEADRKPAMEAASRPGRAPAFPDLPLETAVAEPALTQALPRVRDPGSAIPNPTPINLARPTPPPRSDSPVPGLISQARIMRGQGDTATALIRLKEALAIEPRCYEGLAEMAMTYEAMGLLDKSMEFWRSVFEGGESAGVFFTVAEAKLKQAEQRSAPPKDAVQPGSALGIGDLVETDASVEGAGVRKTLAIPMRAEEGEKIDVKDVVIQVYFYDRLEDGSILQTNANVSSKWTSAPVDWATAEPETLEVEYSDETAPQGSKRKYHGYVVRLYYRAELQDWRAEPEDLRKQFPPPLNLLNDPNA